MRRYAVAALCLACLCLSCSSMPRTDVVISVVQKMDQANTCYQIAQKCVKVIQEAQQSGDFLGAIRPVRKCTDAWKRNKCDELVEDMQKAADSL